MRRCRKSQKITKIPYYTGLPSFKVINVYLQPFSLYRRTNSGKITFYRVPLFNALVRGEPFYLSTRNFVACKELDASCAIAGCKPEVCISPRYPVVTDRPTDGIHDRITIVNTRYINKPICCCAQKYHHWIYIGLEFPVFRA